MKGKILIAVIIFGTVVSTSCQKHSGPVKLASELDSASYCLGINIGTNLKNSPMQEVNYEALIKGIQEIMEGKETMIDEYEANNIISSYMMKLESVESDKNLAEAVAFLEKNKKRNDVITTGSGLQYRIINEGSGPKPLATDMVTVHYKGTLVDGTEFDSSLDGEPAKFQVNRVIQGWQEALQLMPVGSKWELFLPPELGYGSRPRPGGAIRPNNVLIFEVELFSIDTAPEQQ